jgi:hypothetical protein
MNDAKQTDVEPVSFDEARDRGETVRESGYHQPGKRPYCPCDLTTRKGAYKDVTVRVDEKEVHYFHQSPVVVQSGDTYRIDSHGYRPDRADSPQRYKSTRHRISDYLPAGYSIIQEDYTWYLSTPDGREEFVDGMTFTAE